MKKWIKRAGLAGSAFLLVACAQTTTNKTTTTSSTEDSVSTTKALVADDYRMVFVNDSYPVSKNRGITANLSSESNIAAFETGLLTLSKTQFSPSQYYFLEGQFIDSETVTNWLATQSDSNPTGLNATVPGQKDSIISILEQDFMMQVNGNYELSGMSIGVALNPVLSTSRTLSDDDLLKIGKDAANKILTELRTKDGMSQIPIMIGLYKQAEDNGVSRGTYLVTGLASSGATSISSWKDTKMEKRVFPLDTDKIEEANKFNDFKNNVMKFFPNLNGMIGEATFIDNVMTNLNITISTQFYGQSEMIGLTQYIVEQAGTFNTSGLDVKIVVNSVRGTEAVVFKKANDNSFTSSVLK